MVSVRCTSVHVDRTLTNRVYNPTEMSAEPAFLIAAVRHFLDAEAPLPDSQNIDWTAVLRLANAHTVTPMLYNAFRETPIPDAVAEQLRSAFETSVRWSLAQSGELTGLVGLFEEKGIPVVALKGPLLSRYLYGDLSVRSSGDIDVLVKQDDVRRSRDALVSSGCRAANRLHWNSDSACLRLRGQEMAFDSPSGVSIDVHWRLVPPHFPSAFDKLDAWESLATVTLAGRQVHTLAPEPLLLFLCSHGAKHMFERLGWICDIARFLMVTPELDWPAVVDQARRAHALRQVSLGLRLAGDLAGVVSPPPLPKDTMVEPLARAVWNRLLAGATPPAPALESLRFCLRLMERPGHQLRYVAGEYLTPSEAEFRALQLPPRLFFLYYPFRPIRLFWKHAIQRPIGVICGS